MFTNEQRLTTARKASALQRELLVIQRQLDCIDDDLDRLIKSLLDQAEIDRLVGDSEVEA